jgi:PAS domain S-box-containing protein
MAINSPINLSIKFLYKSYWLTYSAICICVLFVNYAFSFNNHTETLVNLSPGLLMAFFILLPLPQWLVIICIHILISEGFGCFFPSQVIPAVILSEIIGAIISASLFKLLSKVFSGMRHNQVLLNFGITSVLGIFLGVIVANQLLNIGLRVETRDHIWVSWFFSNLLGMVLVAPAILWSRGITIKRIINKIKSSYLELLFLLGIVSFTIYLLFNIQSPHYRSSIDYLYLILPFAFWAAIRFHPFVLSLVLIIISLEVLNYVYQLFAIPQNFMEILQVANTLQVFLLINVLFSYTMAFVTIKRDNAERKILKLNERLERRVNVRTRELKAALDAFQQSEEQFRQAFEYSIQGMALISLDGHFMRVNQAFSDMIGYSVPSLLKLNLRKITFRDDFIKEFKLLRQLFRSEISYYQIEKRLMHKLKSDVWVLQSNSLVKTSDDKPLLIVSQIVNITERKQAEKQLQKNTETLVVLLREVNHRVKNNLAALVGLLHMEEDKAMALGKTDYIQILKELTNRITVLATVHSLLSAQNWQPIPLSKLCEQIISAVVHGYPTDQKVQYNVQCFDNDFFVNSNQAHHLSLVFNELVTNSLKYGFVDEVKRKINIVIFNQEDNIKIVYQDNGRGYPDEVLNQTSGKRGVGLGLINGIISQSLDGEVMLRNEGGAVTEISFPKEL